MIQIKYTVKNNRSNTNATFNHWFSTFWNSLSFSSFSLCRLMTSPIICCRLLRRFSSWYRARKCEPPFVLDSWKISLLLMSVMSSLSLFVDMFREYSLEHFLDWRQQAHLLIFRQRSRARMSSIIWRKREENMNSFMHRSFVTLNEHTNAFVRVNARCVLMISILNW